MNVYRRGNTDAVDRRFLSYRRQDYELNVLAEKHSKYGFIDWKNVATELGHGIKNTQCSSRWNNLNLQGKVIIDEAEYMDTALIPDLSYDYDEDVEKAFINQKNIYRNRTVWSPEMV